MFKCIRKICLALLFVCTIVMGVWGTAVADASVVEVDRVTVTGVASLEVAPDVAEVDIAVIGRGATADVAAADASGKLANVKHALLGLGITGEKIENTYYYLNPVYGEKMKVQGYQADNSLKIKVDDIAKLGTVIDKVAASGAERVNGIRFSVSNRSALQNRLLAGAVQNAREQAEGVAAAAGRSLGRLTSAIVQGSNEYEMRSNVMLKDAGASAGAPTVIEPKNVKIRASVECTFVMQ